MAKITSQDTRRQKETRQTKINAETKYGKGGTTKGLRIEFAEGQHFSHLEQEDSGSCMILKLDYYYNYYYYNYYNNYY